MNVIDKAIGVINPAAEIKRTIARQKLKVMNTGYSNHGASRTKKSFLGWNFKGGDVTQDIYKNLDILRQRSRDLYMGAPLTTGAIKTIITNVVGNGLKVKPLIKYDQLGISADKSKELETQIKQHFELWNKCKVDISGTMTFDEVQSLVLLTTLVSGECFVKLNYFTSQRNPYTLRLQIIEPDRIIAPRGKEKEYIAGVKLNSNGEIEAYSVSSVHPLGLDNKIEYKDVPVYTSQGTLQMIHLFNNERPEQLRGIPLLSPVIEVMKQLSRYTEAEIAAAVVGSMFALFIKKDLPNTDGLGASPTDEASSVDPSEKSFELAPGIIVDLEPGESIETANPGRPNSGFESFVIALLRQVGSAIEVPYELLIKHFESSYSASRASLLEAWKMFRKRREWFVDNFTQVVYEEFLRELYLGGLVDMKDYDINPLIMKAYSNAQWNGPSQGQIDPLKEINAASKRVELGISTRARETTELTGGDWEDVINRLEVENKMMIEKGVIKDATNTDASTNAQ